MKQSWWDVISMLRGTSSASMSSAAAGKLPNKLLWRMQLQQPCLSLSQREVAELITSWYLMIFIPTSYISLFIHFISSITKHQENMFLIFGYFWMFCVSFCPPLVALRSWPWNPGHHQSSHKNPTRDLRFSPALPDLRHGKSLQSLPSK